MWLNSVDSIAGKYSLVSLPKIICPGDAGGLAASKAGLCRVGGWFLIKRVLRETDMFEANGRLVEQVHTASVHVVNRCYDC